MENMGIPCCVPYEALCLETSRNFVKTRAGVMTIKFGLHLHYFVDSGSFIQQMISEPIDCHWWIYIENKILSLGIHPD